MLADAAGDGKGAADGAESEADEPQRQQRGVKRARTAASGAAVGMDGAATVSDQARTAEEALPPLVMPPAAAASELAARDAAPGQAGRPGQQQQQQQQRRPSPRPLAVWSTPAVAVAPAARADLSASRPWASTLVPMPAPPAQQQALAAALGSAPDAMRLPSSLQHLLPRPGPAIITAPTDVTQTPWFSASTASTYAAVSAEPSPTSAVSSLQHVWQGYNSLPVSFSCPCGASFGNRFHLSMHQRLPHAPPLRALACAVSSCEEHFR